MKVSVYTADLRSELPMRYAEGGVRAGFPSPAQDYETEAIDLNKELYGTLLRPFTPELTEIQCTIAV